MSSVHVLAPTPSDASNVNGSPDPSMMLVLSMPVAVVFIFEEQILEAIVEGKSDCGNSQSGKGAFEAIEPGERSGVSPLLPEIQISLHCGMPVTLRLASHIRRHGSFADGPDAAVSLRISKPVRFGRGAGAMLVAEQSVGQLLNSIRMCL